MEELLNILISDPIDFDDMLFIYWLEGKTNEEALELKLDVFRGHSKFKSNPPLRRSISGNEDIDFRLDPQLIDLLGHEVLDNYRTFELLDHYLCSPILLSNQTMLQISHATQLWIIQHYYQLDDVVIREILARRMTKNRKDLDEISEITNFPLKRVTRHFDNLKRISSAIEKHSDIEERQCHILNFIETNYILPKLLARRYTCLMFLIHNKFNLSNTPRIKRIPCINLESCAAITMACLIPEKEVFYTYCSECGKDKVDSNSQQNHSNSLPFDGQESLSWDTIWTLVSVVQSLEPDKKLLRTLQDIRAHLSGEAIDLACHAIRIALLAQTAPTLLDTACPELKLPPPPPASLSDPYSLVELGPIIIRKIDVGGRDRFLRFVKNLIGIGSNLSQSREFIDLFEDTISKIGEHLEEDGLTMPEMFQLLSCCMAALNALEGSRKAVRLGDMRKEWSRFIVCCQLCLVQLLSS